MACETLAKVLKRSVGRQAPPLTSLQLRYPLIIHAELMTHRVFSRNARSSRAVPTARLIEEVKTNPFIPRHWGANQKGMQAGGECREDVRYFSHYSQVNSAPMHTRLSREQAWLKARDAAVLHAQAFADAGYHKQVTNRLLAPFLHIDVVLTTTDLDNWFALRDDPAAEPHIRDLAITMREAIIDWDIKHGGPEFLHKDQWHTAYVDRAESDQMWALTDGQAVPTAVMVDVTRCAQVSYTPFHEAKLTIEQEVARHDALISARPMHASPCEHQATPDRIIGYEDGDPIWEFPKLHGNLTGWIQYRKMLPGERA